MLNQVEKVRSKNLPYFEMLIGCYWIVIASTHVPTAHIYATPRWSGDTNYMPVISNTKVMPLGLRTLYTKLRKQLLKLDEK